MEGEELREWRDGVEGGERRYGVHLTERQHSLSTKNLVVVPTYPGCVTLVVVLGEGTADVPIRTTDISTTSHHCQTWRDIELDADTRDVRVGERAPRGDMALKTTAAQISAKQGSAPTSTIFD